MRETTADVSYSFHVLPPLLTVQFLRNPSPPDITYALYIQILFELDDRSTTYYWIKKYTPLWTSAFVLFILI